MPDLQTDPRNWILGAVAGQGALGVQQAAQALYEAAGWRRFDGTQRYQLPLQAPHGAADAA